MNMRLIGEPPVKKEETELEKAVRERLERIEEQCSLLDKLHSKILKLFK